MKNFENRIIVGEIMAKSLVSCFFDSRCTIPRFVVCVNLTSISFIPVGFPYHKLLFPQISVEILQDSHHPIPTPTIQYSVLTLEPWLKIVLLCCYCRPLPCA